MEKTAWFESWFDSPFYRLLYEHRNEQEAVKFLQNLINKNIITNSDVVLDAACGYGRHAHWLARQNFRVVGIDLAHQRIAEAKLYAQHLPNPPDFQVQDMRTMPFNNQFDVVLNLFTSFGYFSDITENHRVILKFREALKPNGKLILDFLNAQIIPPGSETTEQIIGSTLFRIQKNNYETYVEKKIQIFPSNQEPLNFTERVMLFSIKELTEMLRLAGFQIVNIFGDYDLANWEPNSPRVVIAAQTQES